MDQSNVPTIAVSRSGCRKEGLSLVWSLSRRWSGKPRFGVKFSKLWPPLVAFAFPLFEALRFWKTATKQQADDRRGQGCD